MSGSQENSFGMAQWSDFVRGLVDPDTEERMRRVLVSSHEARESVAALELVVQLAAAEKASTPPEWAVRCAKALGILNRRHGDEVNSTWVNSIRKRIAMSLTFDSLTSPALAGTRDAQGDDRQLVFEVDDYRVDLRLEPETDFQHSVLVGQVVRLSGGVSPVAEVPVLALRRDRSGPRDQVVVSTHTSRFGEFQAMGLPACQLDLLLRLDDDKYLELALPASSREGQTAETSPNAQ